MFFKPKKNQTQDKYIDIKNLPILILDSEWMYFFPDNKKTPEMRECEKSIRELLMEQGKYNDQIRRLAANKKSLLAKILSQSSDVRQTPSDSNKKALETSQTQVSQINDALENLGSQIEDLPDKIKAQNDALFQLCVKESYNIMSKNLKEVTKYEITIEKLRSQLAEETAKKNQLEETFKSSKMFLEQYIGKDGIAELDSKYNGSI